MKVMKQTAGFLSSVIKGILFIGISIQTVLGIVWMCCNFTHIPEYGDSLFFLQVSRTLQCDEYTGIFYPVFLRVTGGSPLIVYSIQLAAAFLAGWCLLSAVLPSKGTTREEGADAAKKHNRHSVLFRLFGSVSLLAVPMAAQCHLALLPDSFLISLLLLELSFVLKAWKNRETAGFRQFAAVLGCWLASALLEPDYLYLGALPVIVYYLVFFIFPKRNQKDGIKKHTDLIRKRWYGLLLVGAFLGMILSIQTLTQTKGLYGRAEKSPVLALTSRICWTNLRRDEGGWPEELQGMIEEGVLLDCAFYPDNMSRVFFPTVEAQAGVAHSRELFLQITKEAWNRHGSMILRETAWDVLAYTAAPLLLQIQLTGDAYDSFSPRNVEVFLGKTPQLSDRVMNYGCWWFVMQLIFTVLLQGLQWVEKGIGKITGARAGSVFFLLAQAGLLIIWYTLQGAGIMDYKNTAAVLELWLLWPLFLIGYSCLTEKEKEQGEERGVEQA